MMTKEMEFKRDKTPYYVFACSKCLQYSYVKTKQKTKKCLRCGMLHHVKNLASISEVINGITAAKDRVIILQNEFARNYLGFEPAFHADNEFSLNLSTSKKPREVKKFIPKDDEAEISKFKIILRSLHTQYKEFPRYLIELAAQDWGISKKEIHFLITKFLHEGSLKKTNEGLYSLRI